MLAHGLYDYLAFLLLRREVRKQQFLSAAIAPGSAPPDPVEPAAP
jgi:hypothetical protein